MITVKKQFDIAERLVGKAYEATTEGIVKWQNDKNRIRALKNQARKRNANDLHLRFKFHIENEIRIQLCHQLIREVRIKKLRHIDITHISGVPRPKVTAILNGNVNELTIDLLVRMLGALGTTTKIYFSHD